MIEALKAAWEFLNGDLIQATNDAPTEEEPVVEELDEIAA